MAQPKRSPRLSFEIDKLTRSIEEVATGENFPTLILPLHPMDLKEVTKKKGWSFDWRLEFKTSGRITFKIVTAAQPDMIQGLVSLELEPDHVVMTLVESAPFNQGRNKRFAGVLGNLVAYVCKVSFEHGFDGNVVFRAKTRLIDHYEKELNAVHVGGHLMVIFPGPARYLVDQYFPQ
ncbi:MAG: hypothetical protein J5I62_13965 [Flavobacteriales bacterium]|nr:hypothetical protein [Flavobacteriales bacterium]MEB2342941.1 hypothetical protein [Flavobacteriia bacterium]